jgi:heptosyltransferase II
VLGKLKDILRGRQTTPAFRAPGQIGDASRVLALVGGDLGELFFHMPLLAGIRRTWPGASLDFLVPEDMASLVVSSGLARQVMVYQDKQLVSWKPDYRSLKRTLAAARYDISFVLTLDPVPALEALGQASGAVLRYGPSHAGAWPATNLELRRRPASDLYPGDHLRALAPFLGLEPARLRTAWPLPPDKLRQVAQLVHFNKPRPDELLVGIDPGPDRAGRALAADNLLYLVQQLKSRFSCRVLPLTAPGGEDRLRRFELQLGSPIPPAFNRDTLLDTILLLRQCDLFLTGNTALFHVAVAESVPVVGLFSAETPARWRPAGRPRCVVLNVKRGERIDLAAVIAAIKDVRSRDADSSDHDNARVRDHVPNPLPAPGS